MASISKLYTPSPAVMPPGDPTHTPGPAVLLLENGGATGQSQLTLSVMSHSLLSLTLNTSSHVALNTVRIIQYCQSHYIMSVTLYTVL